MRIEIGQTKIITAFLLVFLAISFSERSAAGHTNDGSTPYDCSWMTPRIRSTCQATHNLITELGEAAEFHESYWGEKGIDWDKILKLITEAILKLEITSLSFEEKVYAQNSVLTIAYNAVNGKDYAIRNPDHATIPPESLINKALEFAAKLAMPKTKSDEPTIAIQKWIGPKTSWAEKTGNRFKPFLFHENIYRHFRAFRILQVGEKRFLFSQLVAFDSEWNAYLTPVVGEIEARRSKDLQAPACIAVFDVSSNRCGAPAGLIPLNEKPFFHLHFVVRRFEDGKANCNGCHRGANNEPLQERFRKLSPKEAKIYRKEHIDLLLKKADENIRFIIKNAASNNRE